MLRKSALIAAVALGAGAIPAFSQEVSLKFAHWVPATHPLHTGGWVPWAKSLEAASGGTIKVQFFPAGQLDKPADHYDMARDGIADVAWLNPGFNPGRWVIASAGTIPLLIKEAKDSSAAFSDWYSRYAAKEMPEVKVCMLHSMHPGMIFSKKPMKRPEDFKGMKYRASNSMEALYVRNHGGTLVNVPQPEIREVLARGVADGTFNIPHSVIAWGIHKEAKYVLDFAWGSPVYALVINKKAYVAMTTAQKKAVDDHCTPDWARKFVSPATDWEAEGRDLLVKAGNVLYKPSDDEMKAWRAGVVAVKDAWAKEATEKGHDAAAIYADLVATLKKYNAYYD